MSSIVVEAAHAADQPEIEDLLDLAFGLEPPRQDLLSAARGQPAIAGLSLVARDALGLVGAISFWPLKIGEKGADALLLGPLAVHPERQNIGIGRSL